MHRLAHVIMGLILAVAVSGCMTVGYSYARDPNMIRKWNGTVVSVDVQNIYNATGVALIGPLAPVEAKGLKVSMVLEDGENVTIIQPQNPHYTLKAGEQIVYIADQGRVWAQPVDYPLPTDFAAK